MNFERFESPESNTGSELDEGRIMYETKDGTPIEITYREFESNKEKGSDEKKPSPEIVFLPGVGLDVDSRTVEEVGKAFADSPLGGKTYAIRSKITENINDVFDEETAGIERFINEKGLKDFVLVGNSQGGDRAITLAARLQEKVRALVLIDSVGLYGQESSELASQFFKDSGIDTPQDLITSLAKKSGGKIESLRRGIRSGSDAMLGMAKDIIRIKEAEPHYAERIKNEVKAMAKISPDLSEVRVPVVLISGENDPISSPGKIAPIDEEIYSLEGMTDLGKELYGKDRATQATINNAHAREKYIQENVFPKSPWCRMLVGRKAAHHGMQLFRPTTVANAALSLIERQEREE